MSPLNGAFLEINVYAGCHDVGLYIDFNVYVLMNRGEVIVAPDSEVMGSGVVPGHFLEHRRCEAGVVFECLHKPGRRPDSD